MIKAAGITAGALFIAIGLAAQLGGGDVFSSRSHPPVSSVSNAPSVRGAFGGPAPAQPSPQASALSQPRPVLQSLTASGFIYTFRASPGGGKKKHKG